MLLVAQHSFEKDRTRPKLGKLYVVLHILLGILIYDTRSLFRGFFPSLGNRHYMNMHANALALPEVGNESETSMRERLALASRTMKYLGTRKALTEFMNSNFKDRYRIIEMPKDAFTVGHAPYGTPIKTGIIMNGEGLYLSIQNSTREKRTELASYLETNTPPDVGFVIFNENTKKSHTNTGDRNL